LYIHLSDIIIFIAAGMTTLMGLGQLLKPPSFRNRILAAFNLTTGFLITFLFLASSQYLFKVPHVFPFQIPAVLAMGPLIYFYILTLTKEKEKFEKNDVYHWIPAILAMVISIPMAVLSGAEKTEILKRMMNQEFTLFMVTVPVFSITLVTVYFFLSMKSLLSSARRDNRVHVRITIISILMLLLLIFSAFAITGVITMKMTLIRVSAIFISLSHMLVYLAAQRYPFLFQFATIPSTKKGYSRSRLEKIDIRKLSNQLQFLMEEEKLFCDEDLTLGRLSAVLEITSHQLSQFLNEYYGKNFNAYINSYRIKEAQELLLDELDRSTHSIADATGFNSYTAFYTAFKKETGMSPAEYRRGNTGDRP